MSFRFLTAGESHGKGLVGIMEGVPAGLSLTLEDIHPQLLRRKQGYGRGARQKIEKDEVNILSGVRLGKTLGSPISLLIWNNDWQAWQEIMKTEPAASYEIPRRQVQVPRPGHADLIGGIKYDHSDMRNVLERASARETTMRVALGSIARKFIKELGIEVGSRVTRIGKIEDSMHLTGVGAEVSAIADQSPVRCLNPGAEVEMISQIDQAKKDGETLGGEFETYAFRVPVGLGSYAQWDRRLEGKIAHAMMSLNAIVGVEMGSGFALARTPGSEAHDEIFPGVQKAICFETNFSGGVVGGLSTGQVMRVRSAMKPLATLMTPLRSVNRVTGEPALAHVERSDVCAVPAAAVISESLLALVLMEVVLEKFGGDSMDEIQARVEAWRKRSPIE